MDQLVLQFKISNNKQFSHWRDLEEYFKNMLIEIGLHTAIYDLTMNHVWNLEHEICSNVVSSVSDLKTNTITKLCRVKDASTLQNIYNEFVTQNLSRLEEARKRGITVTISDIKKNVIADIDIIKDIIRKIPIVQEPNKYTLLQNIEPLHVENTPFGTIYIKKDYVEIWFNDGHVGYIYDIGVDLHNNLYYPMYKNANGNDKVRFAYSRMNDFSGYISVAAPAGECGVSCLNDTIDTEYLIQFINDVREIISMWKLYGDVFPNDPIRLENRAKDYIGYYYKFLGNSLDYSLNDFIALQLEYLDQLISYLDSELIERNEVINYARIKLI